MNRSPQAYPSQFGNNRDFSKIRPAHFLDLAGLAARDVARSETGLFIICRPCERRPGTRSATARRSANGCTDESGLNRASVLGRWNVRVWRFSVFRSLGGEPLLRRNSDIPEPHRDGVEITLYGQPAQGSQH
jgi:hypothetical protein